MDRTLEMVNAPTTCAFGKRIGGIYRECTAIASAEKLNANKGTEMHISEWFCGIFLYIF
jgi:hypothetical protein